jgi:L-aminopeptidase/D-esterase-like protein
MSGEADAVAPDGEGTDDHVRIPRERVVPRLRDLGAVPSPQFSREFRATNLQHRFPPPRGSPRVPRNPCDGSVIIVIATDAPLDSRNLRRLAARSMLGLARTGSWAANGSGDYALAFSTAPEVRIRRNPTQAVRAVQVLSNEVLDPLFLAVVEATEEAIYNSLFRATTMTGRGHTVQALPLDRTLQILRKYGCLAPAK